MEMELLVRLLPPWVWVLLDNKSTLTWYMNGGNSWFLPFLRKTLTYLPIGPTNLSLEYRRC